MKVGFLTSTFWTAMLGLAVSAQPGCLDDGACPQKSEYCVDSDLGTAHVTATEYDTRDKEELRKDVEFHVCNMTNAFVCVASRYDAARCGDAAKVAFDFTHAMSRRFWEGF